MKSADATLPKNNRKYRRLDCAVFEYSYKVIEESEPNSRVDTARGVYIPTGGDKRIWDGSWIARETHIQLCVRNPASLLGAWLHYPASLELTHVCEALQGGITDVKPADPQGQGEPEEDVGIEAD